MLPFPQRDILSLVKEIEAAEAPEGQPPFPDGTRFEAPRGTKAGAKLYALFVGASIAVIVLMISLAATVGALKPPLRSTSIVSFLATAFTVSLCWRWALSRLRFCVILHQDYLQVGRGLAECRFPYQEVEVIYFLHAQAIKVRCNRRTASVPLTPAETLASILALRQRCPNAVLVDVGSRSHLLPTHPTNPSGTLKGLEGHYRRHTLLGGFATLYLALLTVALIRGLMQWQNGNALLRASLQELLLEFLVGVVLITFGGVVWNSWRTARRIRQERLDAAAQAILPGSMNRGHSPNHRASDADAL